MAPRPADRLVITQHLRTLRLTDNLLGFYDGRVPGQAFASEPNWVDDGALQLGICSYALVDGGHALVYDTHVSVEHAAVIRNAVEDSAQRASPSSSATGTSTTLRAPRPSLTARLWPTRSPRTS